MSDSRIKVSHDVRGNAKKSKARKKKPVDVATLEKSIASSEVTRDQTDTVAVGEASS